MKGSIQIGRDNYTFREFVELEGPFNLNIDFKSIQKFIDSWIKGVDEFELQTSGSTGEPKSITISRQQMIASALMTGSFFKLKAGDTALLCLNPGFIGGKMMLVRAMEIGLKLHITPPSSNPIKVLKDGCTLRFAAFVPLQVDTLLKSEVGRNFLNAIGNIIIGGAAVNNELQIEIQKLKSNVYSTYGMTETVSHIALKKLNDNRANGNFCLLPGVKVDLDKRGCLKINAEVTSNQWIVTNDLVELINKEEFRWLGRIDNVINSGGIKIQAEELEAEIQSLVPSLNFMVTSIESQELGQAVVLLSEKRALTSAEMELLKDKLHKYHFPKSFRIIDNLPMTKSGKPDRLKARKIVSSLV